MDMDVDNVVDVAPLLQQGVQIVIHPDAQQGLAPGNLANAAADQVRQRLTQCGFQNFSEWGIRNSPLGRWYKELRTDFLAEVEAKRKYLENQANERRFRSQLKSKLNKAIGITLETFDPAVVTADVQSLTTIPAIIEHFCTLFQESNPSVYEDQWAGIFEKVKLHDNQVNDFPSIQAFFESLHELVTLYQVEILPLRPQGDNQYAVEELHRKYCLKILQAGIKHSRFQPLLYDLEHDRVAKFPTIEMVQARINQYLYNERNKNSLAPLTTQPNTRANVLNTEIAANASSGFTPLPRVPEALLDKPCSTHKKHHHTNRFCRSRLCWLHTKGNHTNGDCHAQAGKKPSEIKSLDTANLSTVKKDSKRHPKHTKRGLASKVLDTLRKRIAQRNKGTSEAATVTKSDASANAATMDLDGVDLDQATEEELLDLYDSLTLHANTCIYTADCEVMRKFGLENDHGAASMPIQLGDATFNHVPTTSQATFYGDLIDTGASVAMFRDKERFATYQTVKNSYVYLADKSKIPIY
ncbi:hypothetical protein HDV05_001219, partial [Chytridiales sp. JEL 0842]